ncbi:MAG: hypothetical protein EAZ30_08660 [Betaproteobacteria bacterium]|nr:MAG: hypothetical protein EAZ43_06275 [Betaproteobacteria bacterium]TAG47601.1 MAG: hypothetical protein EAZ30_08660 [Betaproteobacteria bacterium]
MKPSNPLYPRPQGLSGYFERTPQLRNALKIARDASHSEISISDCIPPRLAKFAKSVRSNGFDLVITVTSPEAAHLAHLLRPDIERSAMRKGLKFNEILIKVQSESVELATYRARPKAQTLKRLNASATHLDSERLQTSLKKLLTTLADR